MLNHHQTQTPDEQGDTPLILRRAQPQSLHSTLLITLLLSMYGVGGCDDTPSPSNESIEVNAGETSIEQAGEIREVTAGTPAGEATSAQAGVDSSGEQAGSIAGSSTTDVQVLRITPRDVRLVIRDVNNPPTQLFELSLVTERGETSLDANQALWRVNPEDLGVVGGGTLIFRAKPCQAMNNLYSWPHCKAILSSSRLGWGPVQGNEPS